MEVALSACLAGQKVRYDGKACLSDKYDPQDYLLICPEILAGLLVPRSPIEIKGSIINNSYDDLINGLIKVVDQDGDDYSQVLLNGVLKAFALIKEHDIKKVILKSKSPSCGKGLIYDGNFNNNLVIGDGILTALLIKNGIEVICEEG